MTGGMCHWQPRHDPPPPPPWWRRAGITLCVAVAAACDLLCMLGRAVWMIVAMPWRIRALLDACGDPGSPEAGTWAEPFDDTPPTPSVISPDLQREAEELGKRDPILVVLVGVLVVMMLALVGSVIWGNRIEAAANDQVVTAAARTGD